MSRIWDFLEKLFRSKHPTNPHRASSLSNSMIPIPPLSLDTYERIKANPLARVNLSHWIREISSDVQALVCSTDANGYLREKALRYLILHYRPEFANRIILRLSDWVAPVRNLSISWFSAHIETFSLRDLDPHVAVLRFVFRRPSIRSSPTGQRFADHLEAKIRSCQKRHFYKLSPSFRSLIYEILLDRDVEIWEFLKSEPIPSLMAIPLARKTHDLPPDFVQAILDSDFWAVKAMLFAYHVHNKTRPPEKLLLDALTANSFALRSMAKHYLRFSEEELAGFYFSQPPPRSLYVSDLKRDCDREHLAHAFLSGNHRDREILLDYIREKSPEILTQDLLMEIFFGSAKLRRKVRANLASSLELDTLERHKTRILEVSRGEPWIYLDLLAGVSKWRYLMEIGRLFQATSDEFPALREKLAHHYRCVIANRPFYSRHPSEKPLAREFFQNLRIDSIPAWIRWDVEKLLR